MIRRKFKLSTARAALATACADERGAAAIIFAMATVVLAPLAVGLFGVYQAQSERSKLQDALDAATLYAARSSETTTAGVDQVGDRALDANMPIPIAVSSFELDDDRVIGHAEIEAPGLFATISKARITADAEVMRGMNKVEVALVLDNTGSMLANNKLGVLKEAATSLVNKLEAAKSRSVEPDPVKLSLVPFSNTVRVLPTQALTSYSTSNPGATVPSWIDPMGKAHWNGTTNNDIFEDKDVDRLLKMKTMQVAWEGCVESRRTDVVNGQVVLPGTSAATRYVPYFWPDEPDSGYYNSYVAYTGESDWKRNIRKTSKYGASKPSGTFNLDSSAYGGPYNKGPNAGCSLQPVVPLTTDTAKINTAIGKMNAIGETNIAMGLLWGFNTLTPEHAYFSAGLTPGAYPQEGDKLRKIIILMTDGENTFNTPQKGSAGSFYSGLGYIWQGVLGITSGSSSARTTAMNNRLSSLCTAVKDKGVLIYTVRVEVKTGSSDLLRNCASKPEMFYDVQSVSQLTAVFDTIAGSIDNLRIAK